MTSGPPPEPPFQPPPGAPQGPPYQPHQQPFHPSFPVTVRSKVEEVPKVANFLLIQGIATLSWAFFCVAAVVLFIIVAATRSDDEAPLIIAAYGYFAVGSTITGLIQVAAARRMKRFQKRTFSLVALWAGIASFPCGTVFCFPTAIALVAYGLTVLTDAAVIAEFEKRERR